MVFSMKNEIECKFFLEMWKIHREQSNHEIEATTQDTDLACVHVLCTCVMYMCCVHMLCRHVV